MDKKPLAYIVEDYRDTVTIFQGALEMAGYNVEAAYDGAVAKKRLTEIVPDLIVLDLHIPSVPGDIILRQIRGDERLKETRVFLATADANMAAQLRDDAELVLLKPIGFSQLKELAERFRPKEED
ncbi:MAG: response regulator [Anaerolineales bacterium]|jgi:CheY-like chemotaxis protein